MAEFSEEEKQAILQAAKSQQQIHIYLMGMDGQPGFCKRIECQLQEYCEKHTKLNTNFWRLVAFLAGSGVLAGGSYGIFQLLS